MVAPAERATLAAVVAVVRVGRAPPLRELPASPAGSPPQPLQTRQLAGKAEAVVTATRNSVAALNGAVAGVGIAGPLPPFVVPAVAVCTGAAVVDAEPV